MARTKKYLASEWLRKCPGYLDNKWSEDHKSAFSWFLIYLDNYLDIADIAESAEWGERAVGLKPIKFAELYKSGRDD